MLFNETVVEMENICKYFSESNSSIDTLYRVLLNSEFKGNEKIIALKDINLSIKKGETIGIIGSNGAGKSTLLQIICGIYTANSGILKVPKKISAILELGAGFNPDFTGKENAILSAKLQNCHIGDIKKYCENIKSFSGLEDFFEKPVKTYSSGMYARLAFSVSINTYPDLLIIDEALSVGDIRFQSKCFKKINELKENGTTIIFVSHDIFAIRKICDRLIWLKDQRVYKSGDVREISELYVKKMNMDESGINKSKNEDENKMSAWGLQVGVINKCRMNKVAVAYGEGIIISIGLNLKKIKDMNKIIDFILSISVKDHHGVDIFVLSHEIKSDEIKSEYVFEFENILKGGDYILACALEELIEGERRYLEYRDNESGFTTFSDFDIHGLVQHKFKVN